MKCNECGTEMADGAKFCSNCGANANPINVVKMDNATSESNGAKPAGKHISQEKVKESSYYDKLKNSVWNPSNKKSREQNKISDTTSFGYKIKAKALEMWNNLDIFYKIVTVAMAIVIILLLVSVVTHKGIAIFFSIIQIGGLVAAILMHMGVMKSPNSWLKYIVVATAIIFTVLNVMSYSWGTSFTSNASSSPNSNLASTKNESTSQIVDLKIEKGTEYAYMSDEWNVYIATAISDSIVKVENWGKTLSSSKTVEYQYDVGVYKINNTETGFSWMDDKNTAFIITLQDKNNSRLKKPQSTIFTININDGDKFKGSNYDEKIICYSFLNDDWHLYRAIPLTESIIKIETWSRSSSDDSFVYGYDVNVINSKDTSTDFEWTDDEHTAFTITMQDPANGYHWKKPSFVAFTLENEDFVYMDVKSYLGSSKVVEGEVTIPASASSYKSKDYQEVQQELTLAGFTNISTIIQYDIVFGWTKGQIESVSIDGLTDYEQGQVFKKDTPVVITYHMKPEDDPAKKSSETEKLDQETSVTDSPIEAEVVLPESDSKLGKDFDGKGTSTVYYVNVDGKSNIPKTEKWDSATVTDGVAEYLDYLKGLGYSVKITSTDSRSPYTGFTIYETYFEVSNSDIKWTMLLIIQDEDYVEYEFDIKLP